MLFDWLTLGFLVQIDKEGANIERVKQGLSEAGLLPEEWGGQTPMVAVSAPACLICMALKAFT